MKESVLSSREQTTQRWFFTTFKLPASTNIL